MPRTYTSVLENPLERSLRQIRDLGLLMLDMRRERRHEKMAQLEADAEQALQAVRTLGADPADPRVRQPIEALQKINPTAGNVLLAGLDSIAKDRAQEKIGEGHRERFYERVRKIGADPKDDIKLLSTVMPLLGGLESMIPSKPPQEPAQILQQALGQTFAKEPQALQAILGSSRAESYLESVAPQPVEKSLTQAGREMLALQKGRIGGEVAQDIRQRHGFEQTPARLAEQEHQRGMQARSLASSAEGRKLRGREVDLKEQEAAAAEAGGGNIQAIARQLQDQRKTDATNYKTQRSHLEKQLRLAEASLQPDEQLDALRAQLDKMGPPPKILSNTEARAEAKSTVEAQEWVAGLPEQNRELAMQQYQALRTQGLTRDVGNFKAGRPLTAQEALEVMRKLQRLYGQ